MLPPGDETPRNRDPGLEVSAFLDRIVVRCPLCRAQAYVVPAPDQLLDWTSALWTERVFAHRRLACPACSYAKSWPPDAVEPPAPTVSWRHGKDPYFGADLWLTTQCCGHELWAYNKEHLLLMRNYLAARLRERGSVPPTSGDRWETLTLLEALPKWMKAANNRREIVRAMDALLSPLG